MKRWETPSRERCGSLLAGLSGVCVLIACGDSTTGATVVVESELRPNSIDEVVVTVAREGDSPERRRTMVGAGASGFPVRVPLVYEGGVLGPIEVSAEGTGRDLTVNATAEPFFFVPGEHLTIPVRLTTASVGDAGVTPEDLGLPDLGPPDLGPPDGGICAEGCTCVLDECVGTNCDCEGGCQCALSCPVGATCDHLHCKDRETECTVDAEGAEGVQINCDAAQCSSVDVRGTTNAYVRCHKTGACCIVDCTGASNCFVDCEPDAYCRVDCTDASSCGFVDPGSCWTDAGPLECGDGVQVCGRATCPPDTACYAGTETL